MLLASMAVPVPRESIVVEGEVLLDAVPISPWDDVHGSGAFLPTVLAQLVHSSDPVPPAAGVLPAQARAPGRAFWTTRDRDLTFRRRNLDDLDGRWFPLATSGCIIIALLLLLLAVGVFRHK